MALKVLDQADKRKPLSVKAVKQAAKDIKVFEERFAAGGKLMEHLDKDALRTELLDELSESHVVNSVTIFGAISEKASRLLGEEVTYYNFDSQSGEVLEEGVHNRQREYVESLWGIKGLDLADAEDHLRAYVEEDEALSRNAAETARMNWLSKNAVPAQENEVGGYENGFVEVQEDGSLRIPFIRQLTEEQRAILIERIDTTVSDYLRSL